MSKSLSPALWMATVVTAFAFSAFDARAFDAEKSINRGNSTLGATVRLFGRDSKNTDTYTVHSRAEIEARILGSSFQAASSNSKVTVTTSGRSTVRLRLRAEGDTLMNYAKDFTGSTTFTVPSYVTSRDVAENTVWAGPVPIKVKAKASISLSGSGSVQVTENPSASPTIQSELTSVLDTASSGAAKGVRDIGSVSFKGGAKLARATLVTRARLAPGNGTDQATAGYQIDWSLAKAEGDMKAEAKVKVPLIGTKTYTKSLGKFLDSPRSGQLAKGTTVLP